MREYEKATDDGDDGVDDDDGDHMRRPLIIWWWLKIVQMVIIELNSDKEKKEIGSKQIAGGKQGKLVSQK